MGLDTSHIFNMHLDLLHSIYYLVRAGAESRFLILEKWYSST